MAASHDSAGFKLFTELYRKKRAKDGRRELGKKEFETKTSAHWKALSTEKHKRYNDEAIRRLTRTPMKRQHACSTRCTTNKRDTRSYSPRRSRREYRSRSPISHRHDDRSRSWSDSSARTEYLGDTSYNSDSSYTDTANTYYDEEDECSDATSCSSIASSYDDLTDPTLPKEPKPTSSKTSKPVKKASKGKAASVRKTSRSRVKVSKKPLVRKTSRRRSHKKKMAAPAASSKKSKKQSKVEKKSLQVTKARKPRPVAAKKVVPLRRTRASRSVNVREESMERATPPRQLEKEEGLKTLAINLIAPASAEQLNE